MYLFYFYSSSYNLFINWGQTGDRTGDKTCDVFFLLDGGKVKSVPVPWALPNARLSWLMKKTIETLQSTKNQTNTARLLRLSFEQVHGVMLRAVERGLEKRDKNRIYKHVCMDEKSIRRGHEYVSILYDGETGQVIEVESGRKSDSVDNLCTKALTEE